MFTKLVAEWITFKSENESAWMKARENKGGFGYCSAELSGSTEIKGKSRQMPKLSRVGFDS